MRGHRRDRVATVLVVAIIVSHIGWLVRGAPPLVAGPRGPSATDLMLGVALSVVPRIAIDARSGVRARVSRRELAEVTDRMRPTGSTVDQPERSAT